MYYWTWTFSTYNTNQLIRFNVYFLKSKSFAYSLFHTWTNYILKLQTWEVYDKQKQLLLKYDNTTNVFWKSQLEDVYKEKSVVWLMSIMHN